MYQDLKSFQQAEIIYDFTVEFCRKYIDKRSRTYDQMVQAARSGKQNIAEGCSDSKQKPKSERFLLAIAQASLKELLEDFKDFLRQRGLEVWQKDDPRAVEVRRLAYRIEEVNRSYRFYRSDKTDKADRMDKTDKSYRSYKTYRSDKSDKTYKTDRSYRADKTDRTSRSAHELYRPYLEEPERAANAMICLINQTTYLLDKQIKALEEKYDFETHQQKVKRIMEERRKKNEELDRQLKEIMAGKRKTLDL